MIKTLPFGATGHNSSRLLFGAAALAAMRQEKADAVISLVRDFGVNHFDVAASYGDAELRLAPFLQDHRSEIFLATKTGDRSRDDAMKSIEASLQRMQVEQIDLIQFHNLTKDEDWATVMGPNGALEAAKQARDQGLVRFIGVTGHGTRTAQMHLRSLQAFDFASVLLPYSHTSMADTQYRTEFEQLYQTCQSKQVAMQTIKSIARRRWRDNDPAKRFSWYEPIKDEAALRRAVHWAMSRPGVFLNSSSDASLLKMMLTAADEFDEHHSQGIAEAVANDVQQLALEPLFVRGKIEGVS